MTEQVATEAGNKNAAQKLHEELGVSKTITLKVPVTLGGGDRLTQLTVRAVTIADVRAVANLNNEIERELKIMARVTGLVPEDLDLLDYGDYLQLQDCFRR